MSTNQLILPPQNLALNCSRTIILDTTAKRGRTPVVWSTFQALCEERNCHGATVFNVLFPPTVEELNKIQLMSVFLFRLVKQGRYNLRACLHGGVGPQVGEVTRFGGVTRLST